MNKLDRQNWVTNKQDEVMKEVENNNGTINFIDAQKINMAVAILNTLNTYEKKVKGLNKTVRNDITLLINKLKQNA